jgi:hypothetical protein
MGEAQQSSQSFELKPISSAALFIHIYTFGQNICHEQYDPHARGLKPSPMGDCAHETSDMGSKDQGNCVSGMRFISRVIAMTGQGSA